MPLKVIELQLGNSDIGVLLTHYIHLDEKMKQDTAQKLSEFVGFKYICCKNAVGKIKNAITSAFKKGFMRSPRVELGS
ncbi:hypothetical protein [Secundilactobacillus malefermentans]|uniref:hypothetical protein n=1 Tax=Secundilactobacillus malefermentans TaxID=176292 RepID=UPI000975B2C5|nr:hypothetical protein [Secundilactobacillus malefermentans]